MNKHYDVAIIGAGISGIMAAYELAENSKELSIALLEQGKNIYKRSCPIIEGKVKDCINCPACSIMKGFGGAGNFSDGKYNITTAFGGWFNEYLPDKEVMELQKRGWELGTETENGYIKGIGFLKYST